MSVINTVGHSTRSLEEFLEILTAHNIHTLADIRTVPKSRRMPHFAGDALAASLAEVGILYRHIPKLGGLRKPRPDSHHTSWRNDSFRGYADYMETQDFMDGLEELLELATKQPTAMMCAEAVPWRCHRSLVADALVLLRKIDICHLYSVSKAEAHKPTHFVRRAGDALIYDGGSADLFTNA